MTEKPLDPFAGDAPMMGLYPLSRGEKKRDMRPREEIKKKLRTRRRRELSNQSKRRNRR